MVGRIDVLRIEAGNSRGTGFRVAPDLVLTALHVVGKVEDGRLVLHGDVAIHRATTAGDGMVFPVCYVEENEISFGTGLDWACLRVNATELDILREFAIHDGVGLTAEDAWSTYGFPDDAPNDGSAASGTITSNGSVMRLGSQRRELYQLFSHQAGAGRGAVMRGYSGAPVVVHGAAIALISVTPEGEDGRSTGGSLYGVPLAAIAKELGIAVQHGRRAPLADVSVHDLDLTAHLRGLQAQISRVRLCDRTAKTPDGEIVVIGATRGGVSFIDGRCTVISGVGGRGKSSALSLLVNAQLCQIANGTRERIPIRLRASEIDDRGVYQAIADEVGGVIPALATSAAVQSWLCTTQTLVLVDDWERATSLGHTAIKRFIRNSASIPCATVVATRDGVAAPPGVVEYCLEALSEEEQQQFALALRPDVDWDSYRLQHLTKDPPYSLRTLLREPVILAAFLRLTSWSSHGGMEYPRDLPQLLDEVLEDSVGRNHTQQREKTRELIAACCELSRKNIPFDLQELQQTVRAVASSWPETDLVAELQDLGVITSQRHSTYDFSHGLWRLHFQTKERIGRIMTARDVASWLEDLDSELELALPFVAALLNRATLQEELFRQLVKRNFPLYCKALQMRATTVESVSPGKERRLLASIRDIYASLVEQLCPNMRPFLDPWNATHDGSGDLLIAGTLIDGSLSYCFSALPVGHPVTFALSHESFMAAVKQNAVDGYYRTHCAALSHYGIRIDSGHAIAIDRLVNEVHDSIMSDEFLEAEWLIREECWRCIADLVGRKRSISSLTLAHFANWLEVNTQRLDRRYVDEVVPMLHRLCGFGLEHMKITELPLPQPDRPRTGAPQTAYTLQRRQERTAALFNAAIKTYREICERYLSGFISVFKFSHFPMKPHVSIMRVVSDYEWDAWYWWEPVASWDETAASIQVVNDRTERESREEVRSLLAQKDSALDYRIASLGLAMGQIGRWGRTDKDVTMMAKQLLRSDLEQLKSAASGIK